MRSWPAGSRAGRRDRCHDFKSLGMAVEDVVAARLVLHRARHGATWAAASVSRDGIDSARLCSRSSSWSDGDSVRAGPAPAPRAGLVADPVSGDDRRGLRAAYNLDIAEALRARAACRRADGGPNSRRASRARGHHLAQDSASGAARSRSTTIWVEVSQDRSVNAAEAARRSRRRVQTRARARDRARREPARSEQPQDIQAQFEVGAAYALQASYTASVEGSMTRRVWIGPARVRRAGRSADARSEARRRRRRGRHVSVRRLGAEPADARGSRTWRASAAARKRASACSKPRASIRTRASTPGRR